MPPKTRQATTKKTGMQKRRSHNKSRKGCQNCKRRHIKCDEQGPPCANCMARNNTDSCTFTTDLLTPPQENTRASIPWGSTSEQSPKQTPPPPPPPPPPDAPPSSGARRLLELELMHRWSTVTYKSFSEVYEDFYYMQVEVPRGAFKYDYMLYGILSVTALEIAMCEEAKSSEYIFAALEYYDEASRSFRAQLSNATPENLHLLYTFSFIAAAINMALPECMRGDAGAHNQTVLERMACLFELLIGCSSLMASHWGWMVDSPLGASIQSALMLHRNTPVDPLDSETKDVLTRLSIVVDSSVITGGLTLVPDLTSPASARLKSYQNAVTKLRECFVEDAKDVIKAFCVSFPITAGRDFTLAFSNSDPVALFIVMHWGVLVHRLNDILWWARDVGRNLVLEISETLLLRQPQFALMGEWQDGVMWARGQAGLPVLE